MFKIVFLFFIMMLAEFQSQAQICTHSNLSYKFDFKITASKIIDKDSMQRTSNVSVKIYSKNRTSLIQEICFVAYCPFASAYENCSNERSFITGKNENLDSSDNDYGDIIVADFNFDGKEDLAIKNDSKGNAGPTYNFYIQQQNLFKKNIYLSEKMKFFPFKINSRNRTLITHVHANIHGYNENIYKYHSTYTKWKLIKHNFIKA